MKIFSASQVNPQLPQIIISPTKRPRARAISAVRSTSYLHLISSSNYATTSLAPFHRQKKAPRARVRVIHAPRDNPQNDSLSSESMGTNECMYQPCIMGHNRGPPTIASRWLILSGGRVYVCVCPYWSRGLSRERRLDALEQAVQVNNFGIGIGFCCETNRSYRCARFHKAERRAGGLLRARSWVKKVGFWVVVPEWILGVFWRILLLMDCFLFGRLWFLGIRLDDQNCLSSVINNGSKCRLIRWKCGQQFFG